MGRTFEQEFTEAVRRIDGNNSHVRTEIDRVHREAARDRHHAFGSVEMQNLTRGDTGQVSPFKTYSMV